MDALLKRREELLKAKEEVERKLKLAAKAKKGLETTEGTEKENNYIKSNGPGTENISPDNGSIILNSSTQKQLVWDNEGKVFAVLTDTKLVLKSFNPSNPFPKLEINLPKPASKDAKVLISGEWIAISFSESQNFIFNEGKWVQIDDSGRLVWIKNGLFLIYKEKSKILSLRDCEKLSSVIKEIEDVESFHYNDETILLEKVDGSLTIYDPFANDEIIYLPHSLKSSSSFNSKQICHFRHDKVDSTLLLVLASVGRLKVFICGIEGTGAEEMSVIPISKE